MPSEKLFRVLVIDDDELDRMAVRRALLAIAPKVTVVEECSATGGHLAFVAGTFDCVLLDFHLPDGTGLDVLMRIRETGDATPVIMLTGVADAQTAAELMKSGATDYIAKSLLSAERLERSLRYALRIREAEEQVRRYNGQLQALSEAALRINATLSLETMLATTVDEARRIVGTARAKISFSTDSGRANALEAVSVNDEHCNSKHGDEFEASLHGREGTAQGYLSVSGKIDGNFADSDRAIVRQLAQLASVAIQNARLFETARAATRARDDMLAIVSHDLRNPVHTIVMAATLLRELNATDNRDMLARQQSEIVLRAANRANRLIADLMDATRIESGSFSVTQRAVSVEQLIHDAVELLAPSAITAGVELTTEVADDLSLVYADSERVLQVFSNLGGNALKFTPRGGRVTLAAAMTNSVLSISVIDSGTGIAADDLAHVFDRYWQGRERARLGAGLGLWIVKGIVEAHGGRIEIESTVGIGTRVQFTLPLAVAVLSESAMPA